MLTTLTDIKFLFVMKIFLVSGNAVLDTFYYTKDFSLFFFFFFTKNPSISSRSLDSGIDRNIICE